MNRFMIKFKNSLGGGKQRQNYEKWLNNCDPWKFKIFYSEYKQHAVIQQNTNLKQRLSKTIKDKYKLKKKLKQNEAKVQQYKSMLQRWSRKHLNKVRGRRFRLKNGTYSRSQLFRRKKQMKEDCTAALSFLEIQGYEVKNVIVRNRTTGKVETITVLNDCNDGIEDVSEDEAENMERLRKLNFAMLVKTKFNISDEAYNAFAQIFNLPKLYSVKKQMKSISDYIPIKSTPVDDKPGVQRDLKIRIEKKLPELVSN